MQALIRHLQEFEGSFMGPSYGSLPSLLKGSEVEVWALGLSKVCKRDHATTLRKNQLN